MLSRRHDARRHGRRDERGLSLVFMALLLVALLGVSSLVVDLGAWQVEASRIQQAADAASLAGVVRLPDGTAAAEQRAIEIAAANGYDATDPDITVTVDPRPGDEKLAVTIRKDDVTQYLSQVVRDEPTSITRTGTAQYVQPVPLGSPRNYLGTGNLLEGDPEVDGDGVENFWLAVSGLCTRREYGDRIAPEFMAWGSGELCTSANARPNPEHDENGYLFGVTVPEENDGAAVEIQMFDAPVCPNGSRAGDENNGVFDVNVKVRRATDLDPLASEVIPGADYTFVGGPNDTNQCGEGPVEQECEDTATQPTGNLKSCWTTLATVTEPGDYYVQIVPLESDVDSRHDNFSLRASRNGTFVPCTSDPEVDPDANPDYRESCTQVYGFEHLPVFANVGNNDPVFFLASIDERHNGKTMQVTLYDAAEGATGIQLLDPNGDPEEFEWEILCADGSRPDGDLCDTDAGLETVPAGGRQGSETGADPTLDVSNADCPASGCPKTFPLNTQDDKYSDRLIRLTVELEDDIADAYDGRTWWKISYQGDFSGDRTTWSVQLLGDPVRLVPNPTAESP